MKILITGANGYLGSRLCQFFSEKGYSIIAACRSKPENKIEWIKKIDQFILGDLSLRKTKSKILKTKPDIFVHLVSLNKSDSDRAINRTLKNNIQITWEMLEISLKLNIKQFINFSSVHAEDIKNIFKRDEATLPNNFYGLSHSIRENICNYYDQNHGLNCLNIRLSNSYGEPVFNISKNWTNIINGMIMEAYIHNKITIISDGIVKRNFIHYRDVCRKLEKVIKNRKKLLDHVIYLKSDYSYSLIQIALIIKSIFYERNKTNISIYTNIDQVLKPKDSDLAKSEEALFKHKNLKKSDGHVSIVDGIKGVFDYLENNF